MPLSQADLHKLSQKLIREGRMPSLDAIGHALKHAAGDHYGRPFAAVSSSTREGSTYQHAIADLDGHEHRDLEADTPGGVTGIGFWADGAEPSRIVPGASPKDAARLGLKYRQKAVLHFLPHEDGTARHYRITLDRSHHPSDEQVAEVLQAHGVEYKTLTPSEVHVVDLEDTLGPNVRAAAKALGGELHVTNGTGKILGSYDSREEGAREFRRILSLPGDGDDEAPPAKLSREDDPVQRLVGSGGGFITEGGKIYPAPPAQHLDMVLFHPDCAKHRTAAEQAERAGDEDGAARARRQALLTLHKRGWTRVTLVGNDVKSEGFQRHVRRHAEQLRAIAKAAGGKMLPPSPDPR